MENCHVKLARRRIQNDLSCDLVSFNSPMGVSRCAQRHDPVDDGADLSLRGGVKRLGNVRHMGAGGADDAQAPHVKTLHIQSYRSTAMGASGDHAAIDGKAVECSRPECWIGNVLANYVHAFIAGETHDFSEQILFTIINAEI